MLYAALLLWVVLTAALLLAVIILAVSNVRLRMAGTKKPQANGSGNVQGDDASSMQSIPPPRRLKGSAYTPDPIVDMLPEDLADAEDESD